MNYPLISEYENEIRKNGSSILNLPDTYEFIPSKTSPIKIFSFGSGAFAGIFKIRNLKSGKEYALRCFLSGGKQENINRIEDISNYLENLSVDWLCKNTLHKKGIKIKDNLYPITLLEWSNGQKLNDYISFIIDDNQKISELQNKLVELSHDLEAKDIAHGDIQSGNVLVEQANSGGIKLKLVDYDAMYIPTLKGEQAIEKGHSSFQHPKRNMSDYNPLIDRFSFWLLLTSLEALKYDKTLWNKDLRGGFNDEDNFLFKSKDLSNPQSSELVRRLRNINERSLNFYLDNLLSNMSSPDRERVNVYAGEHDIEIKRENPAQSDIEGIKEIPAESTKGSISLSKQSPVDNFKFIIKSVPQGVEVYHTSVVESNFLGKTPIELDINQYSSKRIILVGNGKTKSFYLNQNQKEYEIRLDDIDNVYQNNRTEIPEKQENKREESNSAPSVNFSKNLKVYIIILLLIIIALLSWFILSNTLTSRYVPDNDHAEENIKDSEEILMDTISTELPQNTNAQKSLILTDTVGVSKEDTKNELSKYNDYYKSFLSRYFEDLSNGENLDVYFADEVQFFLDDKKPKDKYTITRGINEYNSKFQYLKYDLLESEIVERYGDTIIVLVKIKTESEKDYSYKTLYQKYYYYIDINKNKIFGVKRG